MIPVEDDEIFQDEVPTVMYDDSYSYLLDEGSLSDDYDTLEEDDTTEAGDPPRRTLSSRFGSALGRLWSYVLSV
jgi:hypothetical protein